MLGKRGDEAALAEAIAALRAALEVHTRAADPADWAEAQGNLGEALEALGDRGGDRSGGHASYEGAIASYKAALEVDTADHAPADHANLAASLARAEQKLARGR